ncbi:MAG: hypothetical protein R3Y26_03095 [Rikenellaceae bacterium]
MKKIYRLPLILGLLLITRVGYCQNEVCEPTEFTRKDASEFQTLKGKKILYIEREQYCPDHHNTATIFQWGEVNQDSYRPGAAMRIYDVDTKQITTLLETEEGVIRDPELSYDATKIIFSMRHNIQGSYHIYEMNIDGSNLKQLTFAEGMADIDPVYLPDGNIIFSSTRQPKYCMCNRHIMANLYRMEPDGANIHQIGVSTLFEGHSTILEDGRILYDRWEYVDRNFGDAQGLWTVNPDGTKHSIYYGNNTKSPGAVIDARQIPGTDLLVCIFAACHERPWGALAVIDRKLGVDGELPVLDIMPENTRALMQKDGVDQYKRIDYMTEDPWPLTRSEFLVSGSTKKLSKAWKTFDTHSALFVMNTENSTRDLILEVKERSLFDPMIIEPRNVPRTIPVVRDFSEDAGVFYVQNVYEGTNMEGVEPGSVKYLRVVESPEKRSWTVEKWQGEGAHYPAVNWHSFEVKRILGEVEVKEDGSAHFKAPAGVHLYFQLLDKDKKMIQSMRSGVSLMPGEINGCIGCHEDRLNVPVPTGRPEALKLSAVTMDKWNNVEEPRNFSYMENVQPIWDKHCVSCHDFDAEDPEKFVLAGDKNMYFNASYINLYVKGALGLIGGGPAAIQEAYSWGSHNSLLTKLIDNKHNDVKLTDKEKEVIYAWMDVNGVYYPTYESAFNDVVGGRSPLTKEETKELTELTGVKFVQLATHQRKVLAQLSFDRPELSPCLASIREDKAKYDRAVEIIRIGAERLKETPRGDIESELVMHPHIKAQIDNYMEWLEVNAENKRKLKEGVTFYDK